MKRPRLYTALFAASLSVVAASIVLQARQQTPYLKGGPAPRKATAAPSKERAQDQRPTTPDSPFSLLPGFKIERVTPVEKNESYIVITFDSKGRPVVSQSASGSGSSPRILLDNNNDGIFEAEQIVSDQINTCHGLFYDGTTLYADCLGQVEGDPPQQAGRGGNATGFIPGLYKLTDANGDGIAEKVDRINRYISGMGDHGPHAIRRAPDGGITLMLGNNTFITDDLLDVAATPNFRNLKERQFLPAFRDPRFGNSTREGFHGTLLQLEESKNKFAVLFSGLRNTYDYAYTTNGEAFAFDSDMEWDVNSPWYREVRTVHMIPGGDNGYRNGTGKYQDEYFDILPSVRSARRGSPVGVDTYQSYAFPPAFFDALFEADWSRGRLLYTALTPAGATYTGRPDVAEFVHGEPMPITDLEIGPDGSMYFTTGGGPGTGGLYKVSWAGAKPAQPDMTGILAVVHQPQPLSSFAWANIERIKASMGSTGASFSTSLEQFARQTSGAPVDRARAVLELHRHGNLNDSLLQALVTDAAPDVRAAVVLVAGARTTDASKAVAAAALKDLNRQVQRRTAEALVRQGLTPDRPSFAPVADIYALLASPDRYVRYSARLALEHTPRAEWAPRVMAEQALIPATEGLLALANTKTSDADVAAIFDRLVTLMKRPALTASQKLRVLRAFEVAATEAPATPALKKQVHDALIGQFPLRESPGPAHTWPACAAAMPETTVAGCQELMLAHHMTKVLAWTGEADVIPKVFAIMPKGDTDQPGQIDYMYALRAIDGGWAPVLREQMITWFATASKWRGGSTFTGHVNTIFEATVDVLTDQERQAAYKAVPLFAPLTPEEIANAAAGRGGRGGGGQGGQNAPPGSAGAPGARAAIPPPPAAGGGGGGRGGGPALPATARPNVLNTQERYDNLVFPRGGGPGVLSGRNGGPPNPALGAPIFQQQCATCHKLGAVGSPYGPDLTGVAQTALRRDLLKSIFFPDETINPKYPTTLIKTRDNRTFRGLVVSENAQTVVVKTAEAPDPVTLQKTMILSRTADKTSLMPSDLPDKIGDQNIAHVVAYLMTEAAKLPPPDTPLPGSNLSRQQLMDRMTSAGYVPRGTVAEGRQLFQTLCSGCHIFGSTGTSIGPDLSTVGSRFKRSDLLESILWPSKTISDQYVMTSLTLDDGSIQSGLVAREDAQNVFLKHAANLEGRGLPVPVARIKDRKDSTTSLMPEGLVAALRLTQIDSLLAFLATGK